MVQYAEETPAPASRVRYAPEDPNLPWPWIGLVDMSSGDLITLGNLSPSHHLNFFMEGFSTKGLESLDLNDSDADIRKSSSSIVSRMYVEGYDTSLSGHDFVKSITKHFESCGEVMNVYIPGYFQGRNLNRFSLMYIRGEGAEEKALKLSGSYISRGYKLVVESYPFHAKHLDHKFARARYGDNKRDYGMSFEGFDTTLPRGYVEGILSQELAKCGRVSVYIYQTKEGVLSSIAMVTAQGIDTVEKLLQVCGSDVKGLENIKSQSILPPPPDGSSSTFMPPWFFASSPCRTTSVMDPHQDPNLPKPLGSFLPYPWNARVDSGAGIACIRRNTETGFEQYAGETPAPAWRVRYAPEDPNVPWPWIGLVDMSSGYLYFWNTQTGVTQWQRPPSNYIHGLF
ncbi:unnamed protein product [Microthlaspi erraticum]|uniref:WW domain-containing protein n=1 Tax=Microthlaspi erraticum TaxID=1685480 RepID=A0A6D2IUZ5_9BRAS|nr:unnamed protein product [Microthlaspi erraticum]